MSRGSKYLAQAAYMDIDGSVFNKVRVPDLFDQLLTTVDTFPVVHEKVQQAEFQG